MAIQQNFAAFTPSLNLNFSRSKKLDPRVTFRRSSKATRMNEEGLIEVVGNNVPRFDHTYDASTGTIRSLGLLIEEQRSNVWNYSDQLNTFPWQVARASIVSNTSATTTPDGSYNAEKLVEDTTATNTHYLYQYFTTSSGTTYTASVYVKSAERTRVSLIALGGFTSSTSVFNLTTGTITRQDAGFLSATITNVGSGWYRCSVSITSNSSVSNGAIIIAIGNTDTGVTYTGDGTSGIYIWGAQLEVGAFPTSYIPTAGLETPRALELATMTGNNFLSWYNQLEGTYLISTKIAYSPNPNVSMFFRTLNTAAPGERVSIEQVPGNTLQFLVENAGGSYSFAPPAGGILGNDQFRKTGLTYISTNGTTTVAGASNLSVSADVTSTRDMAKNMNALRLGRYTDTLYFLNGHIQQFVYYPRKLTNSQLQQLTR